MDRVGTSIARRERRCVMTWMMFIIRAKSSGASAPVAVSAALARNGSDEHEEATIGRRVAAISQSAADVCASADLAVARCSIRGVVRRAPRAVAAVALAHRGRVFGFALASRSASRREGPTGWCFDPACPRLLFVSARLGPRDAPIG